MTAKANMRNSQGYKSNTDTDFASTTNLVSEVKTVSPNFKRFT